jgi:predicted RNA-binding Zn-ribbon protein involved in translation (DUF1610 family)
MNEEHVLKDESKEIYDSSFFQPIHRTKVWIVLILIFVAIAVAILYVFQAGDRKTILGNQPIPAGQILAEPAQPRTPVQPLHSMPRPGLTQNVPTGGKINPKFAANTMPRTQGAQTQVRCPRCQTTGQPLCSGCGSLMRPLSSGGLFVCPSCGNVGLPICPNCKTQMQSLAVQPENQLMASQPMAKIGGQFHCPVCNITGLPNWTANGIPTCPACGAQMGIIGTNNMNSLPGFGP